MLTRIALRLERIKRQTSVISPAKLQNASATIDRVGEEARVIGTTFAIALVITAVCALLTLLWAC